MQPAPGTSEWLAQVDEGIVDPDLVIVDPHHHLWPPGGPLPYSLDDLRADVGSGHRVERTVFVECGAAYATGGPPHLAPVGETAFVADAAVRSNGLIAGIVAHADLADPALDAVLDAHTEAGRGLFRGIRDALSRAEDPQALMIAGGNPAGKYADPAFLGGVRRLGERGLSYDSWHYHYQNREFLALARATPETVLVLDHFGTPLGVGPYAELRDAEIFEQWKQDIADIASCDNTVAKLGGLAMPDNGYGWHTSTRPPTSDEFVAAQRHWYEHAIDCFGADRCMFESNFPVDRLSLSYRTFWNAAKKMTAACSASERAALFAGTAERVYRLGPTT